MVKEQIEARSGPGSGTADGRASAAADGRKDSELVAFLEASRGDVGAQYVAIVDHHDMGKTERYGKYGESVRDGSAVG